MEYFSQVLRSNSQNVIDEVLENIFDEFSIDNYAQCSIGDFDYLEDQVPPIATNHVAAQILALALGADRGARGFAAFGIGRKGVQAAKTGNVGSLVDSQWTAPDGTRVNLEVDRPGRGSPESPRGVDTHKWDHIRAMAAAVRRGHAPSQARSVFVTTDKQGRIREVRHVHYERRVDSGGRERIVGVPDAHVILDRPLTPEQAWARNIIQNPEQAQRHGRSAEASRRRQFSLPVRDETVAKRSRQRLRTISQLRQRDNRRRGMTLAQPQSSLRRSNMRPITAHLQTRRAVAARSLPLQGRRRLRFDDAFGWD